jgi:hypothetical protein
MPSTESSEPASRSRSKRGRWLRRIGIGGLSIVALLVWLDGPGQRWLLPMVLKRLAKSYAIDVDVVTSGRLSSNFALHHLSAKGGPIDQLRIAEVRPLYHWRNLLRGELAGVELRGVKARYDLDSSFAFAGKTEAKKPSSIAEIMQQLQQAQQQLHALRLDLDTEEIEIHRSETLVARTRGISLSHASGSDEWKLTNRGFQWQTRAMLPEQTNILRWTPDQLELDALRLSPEVAAENLRVTTPADGRLALDLTAKIANSTWALRAAPGLSEISLTLSDGRFSTTELKDLFPVDIPATATLEQLSLRISPHGFSLDAPNEFRDFRPDLSLNFILSDITHDRYRVERLDAAFEKKGSIWTSSLQAQAYGGDASLILNGRWEKDPTNLEQLGHLSFQYTLTLPELRDMLAQTYPLWAETGKTLAERPPSCSLKAEGQAQLRGNTISDISTALRLDSREREEDRFALDLSSADANEWKIALGGKNLAAKAAYRIKEQRYDAEARFQEFAPEQLTPWLAWLGVELPATMKADLLWSGKGDLLAKTHEGSCLVETFSWQRDDRTIHAQLMGSYQWPQSASLSDVKIRMADQEISLAARYQPGLLTVTELQHRMGEKIMLQGTAELPLPDAWTSADDWFLLEKPMKVRIDSEDLPLDLAHQWLASSHPLPVSGTARLNVQLQGSPAVPEILATFAAKNIRQVAQPDLAAADLNVSLRSEKQQLILDGSLKSNRTDPVSLRARMAYRPTEWRKAPESFVKETVEADATIPRFDLSRFADLAPSVGNLKGILTGNVKIRGNVEKPAINGELNLTNLSATPKDSPLPPLRDGKARLTFTDSQAQLQNFSVRLASGTLAIKGTADLREGTKPKLNFQLKGDALPLWRDDAIISRANADISLTGPLDTATIRGSISIIDSLLYKDVEIIPMGKPFTLAQAAELPKLDTRPDEAAAKLPAPFANWALDLSVKTADPFLVRGNLATGEIHLNCRIGGTLGDPKPKGEAEIRDVTAALPLSRLQVRKGFVRFTPESGLDPILDIRGFSRVSNYSISVFAYGNASAPKILLTSEPPLPDNEIMTLLATGTTTKGLADGSAAQSRAMQLLIEEFRRGRLPLGRRLAPFLEHFEDIELAVGQPDPYSGRQRSSVKLPFAEQWSVFGGVDGEGKTRSLLLFQVRYR